MSILSFLQMAVCIVRDCFQDEDGRTVHFRGINCAANSGLGFGVCPIYVECIYYPPPRVWDQLQNGSQEAIMTNFRPPSNLSYSQTRCCIIRWLATTSHCPPPILLICLFPFLSDSSPRAPLPKAQPPQPSDRHFFSPGGLLDKARVPP